MKENPCEVAKPIRGFSVNKKSENAKRSRNHYKTTTATQKTTTQTKNKLQQATTTRNFPSYYAENIARQNTTRHNSIFIFGKDEVTGSNPVISSRQNPLISQRNRGISFFAYRAIRQPIFLETTTETTTGSKNIYPIFQKFPRIYKTRPSPVKPFPSALSRGWGEAGG
jgi:hypothetical protein